MTMQGKEKNFKGITRYKKVLFLCVGVLALTAGVLTGYEPEQDFTTTTGTQYQWNDFAGQWIVLNYFAPWCAPCLREMPELNEFSRSLPQNTKIFAVNYDRVGIVQARAVKEKYDIRFDMVVTEPPPKLPAAPPAALPATFIIGPDGRVAKQITGEITEQELRTLLGELRL